MNDRGEKRKMLVVSTASPYKFAGDVLLSLTGSKTCDDLDALALLEARTGVQIPLPLSGLGSRSLLHTEIIERTDMQSSVLGFALK
jgi:threonine synthase